MTCTQDPMATPGNWGCAGRVPHLALLRSHGGAMERLDLLTEYPGKALALPGSTLSLPEPGHSSAGLCYCICPARTRGLASTSPASNLAKCTIPLSPGSPGACQGNLEPPNDSSIHTCPFLPNGLQAQLFYCFSDCI